MEIDFWFNFLSILLVIIGWPITFWLGLRQQRQNFKDTAKMNVYESLWKQKDEFQETTSVLLALLQGNFPFILMETIENGDKIVHAVSSEKTFDELQSKIKAIEKASNYISDIIEKNNIFKQKFLQFWRSIEMWSAHLKDLDVAIKTLTSEYEIRSEELSSHISFLQSLNDWDWRKWDRPDLDKRNNVVLENLFCFSAYVEDLMVLVHNELVYPLLGRQKFTRRTLDSKLKVLTNGGLAVILEKDCKI